MSHLKLNSCREHDPAYINFPYLVLFLCWRWVVPPSGIFSSILPNAFSTAKFVQNGHPKVPSTFRFTSFSHEIYLPEPLSVLCPSFFRTPAASSYSYPTATKVDLRYHSVQQSEQQWYVPRYAYSSYFSRPTKLWNPHVNSNHNISHDARSRTNNYAIYPGALNDTYIYEQSACSEYDALSTATFSPAMSTDSTLTLRSPAAPERFFEERARRPAIPAAPSSYAPSLHGSVAPHPSAMSRTTASIHHTNEPSVNTPSDRWSRVNSIQLPQFVTRILQLSWMNWQRFPQLLPVLATMVNYLFIFQNMRLALCILLTFSE